MVVSNLAFFMLIVLWGNTYATKKILPALDLRDPAEYQVLPDPNVYVYEDDTATHKPNGKSNSGTVQLVGDVIAVESVIMDVRTDAEDTAPKPGKGVRVSATKKSDPRLTTLTKDLLSSEDIIVDIDTAAVEMGKTEIKENADLATSEAGKVMGDVLSQPFSNTQGNSVEDRASMPDSANSKQPSRAERNLNDFQIGAHVAEDILEETNAEKSQNQNDRDSAKNQVSPFVNKLSNLSEESPQLLVGLQHLAHENAEKQEHDRNPGKQRPKRIYAEISPKFRSAVDRIQRRAAAEARAVRVIEDAESKL